MLITWQERRSDVGRTHNIVAPTSCAGQFEQPYGPMGPPTLFTIPAPRYMNFSSPPRTRGLRASDETPQPLGSRLRGNDEIKARAIDEVSVVQREWAAKNPRATFTTPITVEDVLNSRMITYPFGLFQCCLVTDGGGALILVSAERARDFPQSLPWPLCVAIRQS